MLISSYYSFFYGAINGSSVILMTESRNCFLLDWIPAMFKNIKTIGAALFQAPVNYCDCSLIGSFVIKINSRKRIKITKRIKFCGADVENNLKCIESLLNLFVGANPESPCVLKLFHNTLIRMFQLKLIHLPRKCWTRAFESCEFTYLKRKLVGFPAYKLGKYRNFLLPRQSC